MEIVISVSEAELEEFPAEEIPDSSGQQEQSSKTSHIPGIVKSLLSIDTSPTPDLLEKIKRGRITHLIRDTPVHDPGSHNCAVFVLYTVSIVPSFTSRV